MKQPLRILFILFLASISLQSCDFFDNKPQDVPALMSEIPITPSTKNGWWIKIDTAATECAQIIFNIGTDEKNIQFWVGWDTGDTSEFDTPVEYRHSTDQLYINATANPPGRAEFCLMYDDIGVKRFSFDNQQASLQKKTDRDDLCY